MSRTYGKFLGIFTRILGKAGGVNINKQCQNSKKMKENEIQYKQKPKPTHTWILGHRKQQEPQD
jgi:hypothetical protein